MQVNDVEKKSSTTTDQSSPPQKYTTNPSLGRWVADQWQRYPNSMDAKKSGATLAQGVKRISDDRVSQLEDLGFQWSAQKLQSKQSVLRKTRALLSSHATNAETEINEHVHLSFGQGLEQLIPCKEEHGDCLVPTNYPPNPPLGTWVSCQRQAYGMYLAAKRAGKSPSAFSWTTEERILHLEALGFVWTDTNNNGTSIPQE